MKYLLRPRAPPGPAVRLSAECRTLIRDAYPPKDSAEMILAIEEYVHLLNSQGRHGDAIEYLKDCETGARNDLQKKQKQKSRDMLKLAGNSAITASIGVVVKLICTKLGIS